MDALTKKWTNAWHEVMDQELGPDLHSKPEARYSRPDQDFRLHFDFWSLSDEGKRKCFSMLPLGNEIAERALEKHAWETNMIITEAEAENMLRSAVRDLSHFTELDISADDPIEIVHGREEELEALDAKPFIEHWLTREVWYPLIENAPDEYQRAYGFVSETLYKATTYYEGVFHTLWPYIDVAEDIDPFANILRMNRCEIKWLKNKDGLIIFYNQDATINDGAKINIQITGLGLQEISDEVLQWVKQREAHHLKRGFPPDRLRECAVGVSGSKPYQIVLRDVDAPEQAIEGELPYTGSQTVKDGVLYTKDGYGLFIDGQEEGIHIVQVSISTQYKNGKYQRKHLV